MESFLFKLRITDNVLIDDLMYEDVCFIYGYSHILFLLIGRNRPGRNRPGLNRLGRISVLHKELNISSILDKISFVGI